MKTTLQSLRTYLEAKKLVLDGAITKRGNLQQELTHLQDYQGTLDTAKKLAEACRAYLIQSSGRQIEEIVTFALQSVLGDVSLQFAVEFLSRRNQFEVDLYNLKIDGSKEDPLDDCGGTYCDVSATSLLIVLSQLLKVKGPLFLDEVGKHVSPDMAPRFAQFIRDISHKLDRQVVFVTHLPNMVEFADKSFEVSLVSGRSVVR